MMHGFGIRKPLGKITRDLEDLQKRIEELERDAVLDRRALSELILVLKKAGLDLLILPTSQDKLEARVAELIFFVTLIVMLVYDLCNTKYSIKDLMLKSFILGGTFFVGKSIIGRMTRPSAQMMEDTCEHFNQLRDRLQVLNGAAPLGVGRLAVCAPGEGTCIQRPLSP